MKHLCTSFQLYMRLNTLKEQNIRNLQKLTNHIISQRKITLKKTVTITALNRPVPQVHHLSVTTSSQSHQMNLTRLLLHCHEKKK